MVSLISPYASPAPHPTPGSLFQLLNWPPASTSFLSNAHPSGSRRSLETCARDQTSFAPSPRQAPCTQSETQGPPGAPEPDSLAPSHARFPLTSGPLHVPRPLPGTLTPYSYKLAPSPPSGLPEAFPDALYKILPSMLLALLYLSHTTHHPTCYVRVPLPPPDVLLSLPRVRVRLCPRQHPPGLQQARHWVDACFGLNSAI